MEIPNFCIVVAIDRQHADEFAVSYPTWMRHKPSLRNWHIFVILDRFRTDAERWETLEIVADTLRHSRYQPDPAGNPSLWSSQPYMTFGVIDRPYGDQREKMLASLALDAPQYAQIGGFQYFLKLDTDVIATGNDNWIDPAWFRGNPALIGSPWGYTKPAGQLHDFKQWSDRHPGIFPREMPICTLSSDGSKAFHSRMISYCMFGQTDWTCRMSALVGDSGRLPIASQDGFHSLCAARNGAEIRYVKMNRLGWSHIGSNPRRLREAAAKAMELPQT